MLMVLIVMKVCPFSQIAKSCSVFLTLALSVAVGDGGSFVECVCVCVAIVVGVAFLMYCACMY